MKGLNRDKRWILVVASVLMLAGGVLDLMVFFDILNYVASIMAGSLLSLNYIEEGLSYLDQLGAIRFYVCMVLLGFTFAIQFITGIVGFCASMGKISISRCNVAGILAIGYTVVMIIVSSSMIEFDWVSGIIHLVQLLVALIYLVAVAFSSEEMFWDGIKLDAAFANPIFTGLDAEDLIVPEEVTPEKYLLDGYLAPCDESPDFSLHAMSGDSANPTVQILTFDMVPVEVRGLFREMASANDCIAESFEEAIVGCCALPRWRVSPAFDADDSATTSSAYILSNHVLSFITDDPAFQAMIRRYIDSQRVAKVSVGEVFAEFLLSQIRHDREILAVQHKCVENLEDNMAEDVNEIPKDFHDYIVQVCSRMRGMQLFYKQLISVSDVVEVAYAHRMTDSNLRLFKILGSRSQRLLDYSVDVSTLAKEIREAYSNKIDTRLNNSMQVLTVISSVFMPLTLLTGWYGMNFQNMPELNFKGSYLAVMIIAVLITTVQLVFFKRKKWL